VSRIEELVHEHFDLRPGAILNDLNLRRPIYVKTAAYGHFGREEAEFTWEKTPLIEKLKDHAHARGTNGSAVSKGPASPDRAAPPKGGAERESNGSTKKKTVGKVKASAVARA
jgi:hypothetical protein